MTAALAVPVFDPGRTLIRAGARLYAGRCLRAGQRRKVKFRRPAVRLNLFCVETVETIFVGCVQFALQMLVALAQRVGRALRDALAFQVALPDFHETFVDCFRFPDLALVLMQHLGDITAQPARQLYNATLLQVLEGLFNLLCRLRDVRRGQAAAAARHGVGPVHHERPQCRVEILIQHPAGGRLPAEQSERVAPAMPCDQQVAAFRLRPYDERLMQTDDLDGLRQLFDVGLRVSVRLIFLDLVEGNFALLHSFRLQFCRRLAHQGGKVKFLSHFQAPP